MQLKGLQIHQNQRMLLHVIYLCFRPMLITRFQIGTNHSRSFKKWKKYIEKENPERNMYKITNIKIKNHQFYAIRKMLIKIQLR